MNRVLDTGALLAFFQNQSVADEVQALIVRAERARQKLWITPLAWGDLYSTALNQSPDTARRFSREMATLPIEVYFEDKDFPISREAARLRHDLPSISLADSHALALARIKRAELWTLNPKFRNLPIEIRLRILSPAENK